MRTPAFAASAPYLRSAWLSATSSSPLLSPRLQVCGHVSMAGPDSAIDAPKAESTQQAKREGYLSWDDYFMALAFLSAQRSKDPHRQVGACIVGEDKVILGIGYNGFPRGIPDDDLPWSKTSADGDPLKTKYPYVCHAEMNAILNRINTPTTSQRIYVTMFPCNECAKLIIQAGIKEVVYFTEKAGESVDGRELQAKDLAYVASKKLLAMAGIKFWKHKPAASSLLLRFE